MEIVSNAASGQASDGNRKQGAGDKKNDLCDGDNELGQNSVWRKVKFGNKKSDI